MSLFASVSIAEIKARGSIKDADVARLRKNFAERPVISVAEADALRSLNDACPIQDPAWCTCFVELMTEFIVEQLEPIGYVNAANCALLRSWIAPEGRVAAKIYIDLLVEVIAASRWVPQSLVAFGLEQVRHAVVECSGPLRAGRVFEPRTVTDGDVAILREMMQAFTSEGSEGVTRAEAAILLEIDRATSASDNHPAWRQLFTAAIGTSILAASGYLAQARLLTLSRGAWQATEPDLEDLLSGKTGNPSAIVQGFKPMSREAEGILRLTQQKVAIVTREDVPAYDPGWIAAYLAMPGSRTPNMLAVLRLLKREGCRVDERLQSAIEEAAAA